MRFCDLAHIFHKYRTDKKEDAAMCVLKLTDAILEDTALESLGHNGKEVNPLYDKSKPNIKAWYNASPRKSTQMNPQSYFKDPMNSILQNTWKRPIHLMHVNRWRRIFPNMVLMLTLMMSRRSVQTSCSKSSTFVRKARMMM